MLQLLEDVLDKIYREQQEEDEVDGESVAVVQVQADDHTPVATPQPQTDV